jgi:uncharacterized membrane protein YedE/YeeE
VAGMARRTNILDFLSMGTDWNPSLLFVLGCGVLLNLFTFNYMLRIKYNIHLFRKVSFLGHSLFNPANKHIDLKLIGGAFCFGLGWGIGGLCPGPFLVQLAIFTVPVHVIWFGCLLIGMFIAHRVDICTSHKHETDAKHEGNKIQN